MSKVDLKPSQTNSCELIKCYKACKRGCGGLEMKGGVMAFLISEVIHEGTANKDITPRYCAAKIRNLFLKHEQFYKRNNY